MVKEIEVVAVPGEHALAELMEALGEAQVTGFHPILVGDGDDYDCILEGIESGEQPESILMESIRVDLMSLFEGANTFHVNAKAERDGAGFQAIIAHLDPMSGRPKPKILIRNFKVTAPWHAFAHLAWGGWNSSPSPKVHCALHRHWSDCYGAKVVSMTRSEVQCVVDRPPTDHASALELARQQFAYCGNTAESAADLANKLLNARFWYFSWS